MQGYDIIGDVHGCATALEECLGALDYRISGCTGVYEHADRQAIFVGDLVDRGRAQLRVLEVVKGMVDHGCARVVMGNHEFNAIAYDTPHPTKRGEFLRPRNKKNDDQHEAFLTQLDDETRAAYLEWFMTLPLWLDLGELRVVHACWHEPSMRVVKAALGKNQFSSREQFVRATDENDPLYEAVEVLLKGPELSLTKHDQPRYCDKGGDPRGHARLAWWRDPARTLRDLAVMDGSFTTETGEPYPALPDIELGTTETSFAYRGEVPVFYGHYWRSGDPQPGIDFTERTACVDFSAIDSGKLVAYRWSGEEAIDPSHYVNIG